MHVHDVEIISGIDFVRNPLRSVKYYTLYRNAVRFSLKNRTHQISHFVTAVGCVPFSHTRFLYEHTLKTVYRYIFQSDFFETLECFGGGGVGRLRPRAVTTPLVVRLNNGPIKQTRTSICHLERNSPSGFSPITERRLHGRCVLQYRCSR